MNKPSSKQHSARGNKDEMSTYTQKAIDYTSKLGKGHEESKLDEEGSSDIKLG